MYYNIFMEIKYFYQAKMVFYKLFIILFTVRYISLLQDYLCK